MHLRGSTADLSWQNKIIRQFEDESIGIIESEEQSEKRTKKNVQSLREHRTPLNVATYT